MKEKTFPGEAIRLERRIKELEAQQQKFEAWRKDFDENKSSKALIAAIRSGFDKIEKALLRGGPDPQALIALNAEVQLNTEEMKRVQENEKTKV
ncbi:MAG: hypothetical protein ABI728_01290 [Betaproteobacteria bacterium]